MPIDPNAGQDIPSTGGLPPPNFGGQGQYQQANIEQYIVDWAYDNGLWLSATSQGMDPAQAMYLTNLYYASGGLAPVTSEPGLDASGGMVTDVGVGPSGVSAGGFAPFLPTTPSVKQFPASKIPDGWKMKHQRARGGHIAYMGKTEAAYFPRKGSANAFVRCWNEMVSHLGSASEFDQLRLGSLFAAVLEGGSGQQGVANGFRPPLNGN